MWEKGIKSFKGLFIHIYILYYVVARSCYLDFILRAALHIHNGYPFPRNLNLINNVEDIFVITAGQMFLYFFEAETTI